MSTPHMAGRSPQCCHNTSFSVMMRSPCQPPSSSCLNTHTHLIAHTHTQEHTGSLYRTQEKGSKAMMLNFSMRERVCVCVCLHEFTDGRVPQRVRDKCANGSHVICMRARLPISDLVTFVLACLGLKKGPFVCITLYVVFTIHKGVTSENRSCVRAILVFPPQD